MQMNYKCEFTITGNLICKFASVSRDYNPLHLNERIAKQSRFGKCIAHGMLILSLISGIMGSKYPGPGTIICDMLVKFCAPVYVGDTIEVELSQKDKSQKIIYIQVRRDNRVLIDGHFHIIPPDSVPDDKLFSYRN